VRVNSEVKIGHHARDILTIEIVGGGVDVSDTPVGVVITVGAGAERSLSPEGWCAPVVVVMTETI